MRHAEDCLIIHICLVGVFAVVPLYRIAKARAKHRKRVEALTWEMFNADNKYQKYLVNKEKCLLYSNPLDAPIMHASCPQRQ